ncbi:hypothetical protein SAMN02746019_00017200, partial [Thermoflexus hugenholtzii JAD2]
PGLSRGNRPPLRRTRRSPAPHRGIPGHSSRRDRPPLRRTQRRGPRPGPSPA